jgi:YbbR domain-containing protein
VTGKARGRVELSYQQTNAVVKGSRRLLSPLDADTVQIGTEPIDVDGRSQSFNANVRLIPPGDAHSAIVEPHEIMVNVLIHSEKKTAKIERVPVIVFQASQTSPRWRVEPETVDVEVTGRSEVIDGIAFGEIVASVSGEAVIAMSSVTNEVAVTLHIRQGLAVDEMRPIPAKVKLIPLLPSANSEPKVQ